MKYTKITITQYSIFYKDYIDIVLYIKNNVFKKIENYCNIENIQPIKKIQIEKITKKEYEKNIYTKELYHKGIKVI